MPINDHVLPGDLVVTTTWHLKLWQAHPETPGVERNRNMLAIETPCFIISREPAGTRREGHVFFVLTSSGEMGWIYNHNVRPIFTHVDLGTLDGASALSHR